MQTTQIIRVLTKTQLSPEVISAVFAVVFAFVAGITAAAAWREAASAKEQVEIVKRQLAIPREFLDWTLRPRLDAEPERRQSELESREPALPGEQSDSSE
jgi:hypothetical protein